MKIIMLCDFFQENQQYQENLLAKYYLKKQLNVTIITSTFTSIFDYYLNKQNKNNKPKTYYFDKCKIIRQPYFINFFNKIRLFKNLKTLIYEESPDIIYIHGMPINLISSVSYKKRNPRCKLIFDMHADFGNSANSWLSKYILHKIVYKFIIKSYVKKIDKIFYITPDGGRFMNILYNIPFNKMNLLPLGADTDYIDKIKINNIGLLIRKELGIKPDEFVIFTGGKITKAKRLELVIKSFFLIGSLNIHLIIVGEAININYKNEILSLINLNKRIHFIGWVEGQKIYDYMLACDIAIFPSSQSVLWQHAIGVGLPLIVGQVDGQDPSYLNKNNNMIIINKNEINENVISEKVRLFMDDKIYLTMMKKKSLKLAEEMLSYDKIVELTLN